MVSQAKVEIRVPILTDFDVVQFDAIETHAAALGMLISAWVAEAVTRAIRPTRRPVAQRDARPKARVEKGRKDRVQVRIRVDKSISEVLAVEAERLGIGTSTIVREIALAAASASHLGLSGTLRERLKGIVAVAHSACRRTAVLRP